MQKWECRKFAEARQREIVKEIQVQGKSGRLDIEVRDDLHEIFELAEVKVFDILLVFMFDRIGRRSDETSVFTLVLDQLGIQIWSVQEGQLDFSNHIEKLRNYINYWHAENESINLSKRVKTKMNQLAAEGRYRGGNIPFGYKLILNGRTNRAGQYTHDLEIDAAQADIVKNIFAKEHMEKWKQAVALQDYLEDLYHYADTIQPEDKQLVHDYCTSVEAIIKQKDALIAEMLQHLHP